MKIQELRISNLRNLTSVSLRPHPGLNFISGENGAGKTSVLEAMVVLSRGRSFRTAQASELIGKSQKSFQIFAHITHDDTQTSRIGLERAGKHWKARKNGKDLAQISQLTRSLPLVLLEPNSHMVVSGTPEYRRRFLDWGVFHVEPGFLETWSRYSRALKQRNAALRNRQTGVLDGLDSILAPLGAQLSRLRSEHADRIKGELQGLIPELCPEITGLKLTYQNGWGESNYQESLLKNRERDLDRGMTTMGPHRADLALMQGASLARTVMSRGEQKSLTCALLMAQAKLLVSLGERPVILLDDLASEFDARHFDRVLQQAQHLGGQVWVTGTKVPSLNMQHKVFHVKHGALQEVV